jgi:metal-responsive CopG/Arc/MetJ family transcriptional regulator
MRKKIPDDMKREKFTVSIDERLYEMLETFLKDKGHPNRSKYIESLIEKDMKDKGHDIKKDF